MQRCVPVSEAQEDVRHEIESGRPTRSVRDGADADRVEMLDELDSVCAPVMLDGQPLGVLHVAVSQGSRVLGSEVPLVAELARHLAIALARARVHERAIRAVDARDNMLAVVSHDLRSPLQTIRLGLQVIASLLPPDRSRDPLEIVRRALDRQARLIDALGDAGMIDAGMFVIDPTANDVAALIADALTELTPHAEERGLALEAVVAGELPPVSCDRTRIFQVLSNVVDNAIRFSITGATIRIVASRGPAGVRIAVEDTGQGMSSDQVVHAFDRYWKGSPGGTGLGLFIAKAIVEAHGGRIDATSEPGVGTTVAFTLPASPPM
jgi:signal transduction histidine kinase